MFNISAALNHSYGAEPTENVLQPGSQASSFAEPAACLVASAAPWRGGSHGRLVGPARSTMNSSSWERRAGERQWQRQHRNSPSEIALNSYVRSSLSVSASCLRNIIADYTKYILPDKNGEKTTSDDRMSSSALITQAPPPKRDHMGAEGPICLWPAQHLHTRTSFR